MPSPFIAKKVVAQLPAADALTPSTLYFVRGKAGFDLYLTTDAAPVIARALNQPAAENMFETWELKRSYWGDQIHENAAGKWLALNGEDVTAFLEQGYGDLMELRPDLFQVSDSIYMPMTSNTAPAPQVVTFSGERTTSGGIYAAWNAFSTGTGYWNSNGGFTTNGSEATGSAWLQIDLGALYAKKVREIGLVSAGNTGYWPKDFKVLASNDAATWDTLLDITGEVWGAAGITKTWTLFAPTLPYRYYKLQVTRLEGLGASRVELARFILNGLSARVIDSADPRDHSVSYVKALW